MRSSQRVSNILLIFSSLLVGSVLIETVFRLAGFTYASMYIYDSSRGWALRPGIQNRVTTESGRIFVRIKTRDCATANTAF